MNSYSRHGAFAAIASKTCSDDEGSGACSTLLGGLSLLSVAQEFSCSYPLLLSAKGPRVPRPSRVRAMWRCLPPDSESTGKYLPIREVGDGVVVAIVDVFAW